MAQETDNGESKRGALARVVGGGIVTLGVIATVFAASFTAVQALKTRAENAPQPDPVPPLAVAAFPLERQNGYDAVERYAGRIEPARATDLAFERAGRVAAVLVEEGDQVAAGAPIARLETSRLDAEKLRLDAEEMRVRAELELAERTQKRQQRLEGRGFASRQRLDEAVSREAALQAALAAIAAQKQALEVDLEDSVLTAPFAGLIAARRADQGAYATPGAPIAELLEISKPQARIGLPPEVAATLTPGETRDIAVGGIAARAKLVALRPDISATTRTVPALFDITWPEGVRPPAFGEVARLASANRIDAPGAWVPMAALQEGVKGLWSLFVLAPIEDDRWRVDQEAVAVIHAAGGRAYVDVDLAEGAWIVAGGVNRISRGQVVRKVVAETHAPAIARQGLK